MLDAMLRADGLTQRRRRQRRAAAVRGRDGPRAVRRRGGRAVVAPALLVGLAVARTPRRCSTSHRDHLSWHGDYGGVRRGEGEDLPPHASSRARLQRRGPGDPHDGRGGRGRRGLPGDRLHPGHPRDRHARGRRRRDRRPRVHRGPRAQRRRARAGVRRPDRRAAQSSRTRCAAATLARSFGVDGSSVRQALQSFPLDRHRIEEVAVVDGVRYVDDSKATNPHAALASLRSFDSVVWIAGGLAKGATFDELVAAGRRPAARRRAAGRRPRR